MNPLNHPHYQAADYTYLREKGYSDAEIVQIWDRDRDMGKPPVTNPKPQVFDLVGYLNQ